MALLPIAGAALSLASMAGAGIESPAEKQAAQLANQQAGRQVQLLQQLDEMGRPVMDAEVDRLNQLLGGNLGISDAERMAQERFSSRALGAATQGASSLGAGLRGQGATVQSAIDASADLAAQNAAMERRNRLMLGQQLAGAEARAEAFNEIAPFQEYQTELQALAGAEQQNQYLAALMKGQRRDAILEGIGGLGNQLMTMGAGGSNPFAGMFGGGGAKSTPTLGVDPMAQAKEQLLFEQNRMNPLG